MIGAALALPVAGQAAEADPVARAIDAIGGAALLRRVKALRWDGRAQVFAGERVLDIAVQTRVEPFGRAESRSWLVEQGNWTARTMTIENGGGSVLRDGARSAMPPAQAEHERQQFAIYGYSLLALAPARPLPDGRIEARRDGLPPVQLTLDAAGRVRQADYVVADPEGPGTIAERFGFEGSVSNQGVSWFKRMTIAQAGKPYFTLSIDAFGVELA